jgi:hypothetical protein
MDVIGMRQTDFGKIQKMPSDSAFNNGRINEASEYMRTDTIPGTF